MNIKNLVIAVIILAAVWFIYDKMTTPDIKNLDNAGRAIVAFGNSLTYGAGAPRGEDYPAKLAKKTGHPVINLGVSGDRSTDGLVRINSVFQHNPYMVLIEFGGNDYMKKTPFDQTAAAVEQMINLVQAHGAIAVVVDTGGPFMGEYTKTYKKMAGEKGAVFVPAILDGIITDTRLKSDPIHPNAAGYTIVADRVYNAIEKYLKY
ncbi:MAG: GDSL-type esterase/lipase family protein [Syntrophobacterales bacterium]|jgi:lysophospholipase L1-like esterase|nr:GDSL-type esterase/lipase family protein [Syntrophobacterales bacterium]